MVNFVLRKLKKRCAVHSEQNGDGTRPLPRSVRNDAGIKAFQRDPMRVTDYPDVLGEFIDPMGGNLSYTTRNSIFSTGAWN